MGTRFGKGLYVLAVLAGAIGWWLPYIAHHNGAAALVLLGLDLGDFWKFTNEWKVQNLFVNERHLFFLPPALAAILLSLWLGTQRGKWRLLFLPLLLFLALVILPALDQMLPQLLPDNPFVFEDAGYAREFSFQLWLSVATILTIAAIPLWQRVPPLAMRVVLVIGGVVGAILPAYALWYTWEVLQSFYGGGAVVGIGIFVTALGFGISGVLALLPINQNP